MDFHRNSVAHLLVQLSYFFLTILHMSASESIKSGGAVAWQGAFAVLVHVHDETSLVPSPGASHVDATVSIPGGCCIVAEASGWIPG